MCLCVRASWRVFVTALACATHPSVARATRALLCSWVLCWRALSGDTRGAQARSRKKRVPHFQKKEAKSRHGTQDTRPGLRPYIHVCWSPAYNSCWRSIVYVTCSLYQRYRHNVLSQPGPEHGRVGVHPRTHAAGPGGHESPTALSALFPTASGGGSGAATGDGDGSEGGPAKRQRGERGRRKTGDQRKATRRASASRGPV